MAYWAASAHDWYETASSTPLHLIYAKCNDKNILASHHGQMPHELQMTQSTDIMAFDIVEHAKSLTQLHDLVQREKCLGVVPLISH